MKNYAWKTHMTMKCDLRPNHALDQKVQETQLQCINQRKEISI